MKLILCLLSAAAVYRLGEDSNIQPSHLIVPLVTISMIIVAFSRGSKFKFNLTYKILIFCVSLFFFRNIFEILLSQQDGITANALYWINFASLLILMHNVMKEEEWRFLVKALMFNVCVSSLVAVYQLFSSFPVRAHGLSGTENHLAMQIVHASLIYMIFHRKSNYLISFLRMLGLATLSRAYMIHLAIVFLKTKIWVLIFGSFIVFIILGSVWNNFVDAIPESESIEFLAERLNFKENSSDQDGRGHLRILHNPQYFIYGASEVVRNFNGDPFFGQIHSNFVSLAFCFGIPGILFSILILWKTYLKVGLVLSLSYLLYSLSLYFYSNAIFLIFVAYLFRGNCPRVNFKSNDPVWKIRTQAKRGSHN